MSELRDQHKAFAEWFLQQNTVAPNAEDLAWAAWKAALAQPEAEPEPVAWQVRWIDPEEGPGAWRCCLDPSEADYYANREDHDWRPLYTHPPRDEWREAASALDAAKPLIKWLNDNHNPHTTAIVTTTGVEILVGIIAEKTTEFVHD